MADNKLLQALMSGGQLTPEVLSSDLGFGSLASDPTQLPITRGIAAFLQAKGMTEANRAEKKRSNLLAEALTRSQGGVDVGPMTAENQGVSDILASQGGDALLKQALAKPKETSAITEARFLFPDDPAKQRQFIQSKALKPQSVVNVGGNDEAEFQKQRAKSANKIIDDNLVASDVLGQMAFSTKKIENALIKGADVSTFAGQKATFGEIVDSLGFDIDMNKIASTRDIERESKNLSLELTKKLKGAISEKELQFVIDAVGAFGKSEEATIRAIAAINVAQKWQEEKTQAALDAQGNARTAVFNWRKENPITLDMINEAQDTLRDNIFAKREEQQTQPMQPLQLPAIGQTIQINGATVTRNN